MSNFKIIIIIIIIIIIVVDVIYTKPPCKETAVELCKMLWWRRNAVSAKFLHHITRFWCVIYFFLNHYDDDST
jgi:hypothetical protein